MMKTRRKPRKIYPDIVVVIAVAVFFAVFFVWKFENTSKQNTLNTLSEISNQSVNVIKEEINKNKTLLVNLAIYMRQGNTKDIDKLMDWLKAVNSNNGFKRMGIVAYENVTKTTDGLEMVLDQTAELERFRFAKEGRTTISDTIEDLDNGKDVTTYATPINWPDGTRYVLFGTYAIESYEKNLSVSTFNGEGFSYIIKKNGDRVIHSQRQKGYQDHNFFDFLLKQSKKNETDASVMKTDMKYDRSGFLSYDTGQGTHFMYYQPLDINDWYFLSVIPQSVVETQINGTLVYAYLILLIFIIGIGYLIVRMYLIHMGHKKMLMQIAYVDEVTGLSTYAKFKVDTELLISIYKETKYAIVAFNIQHFQYINDLYGYEAGDQILNRMSTVLGEYFTEHECAARMQADHFVALAAYESEGELISRIEEILNQIQEENNQLTNNVSYTLKVDAGIYLVEQWDELLDTMVDRAFAALRPEYNTKMKVCNFYDGMVRNRILRNKEIANDFAEALENRQFYICYQPKYTIRTGTFEGAEALVRWKKPNAQIISPGEFIPILEQNGGIVELDEYVLERVCEQICNWIYDGCAVTPVSVNVSQLHLYRKDFVDRYLEIINHHQVPHELIQLEITETALFDNKDILLESLNRLRREGIRILMDDFGTGYSSVSMLKNMPIDILKIDKSMIDPIEESEKGRRILDSIIKLAQSLDLKVTAEGVERKPQYDILVNMGVDDIQGHYCARPMSVEEYENIIRDIDESETK